MRRSHWVALASAALVAALAMVASFGPLVRWRIQAQAEKRGLEVNLGSVKPGLGRLWFRNLTLRIPDVPALAVELAAAEVKLSPLMGLAAVSAHGGRVKIHGSSTQLTEQLKAWRAKRGRARGDGAGTSYTFDGIDLSWDNAWVGADPMFVWGLRWERPARGAEVFGADLVRVGTQHARADVVRPEVVLRRQGGARRIERFAAAGAEARVTFAAAPTQTTRSPPASSALPESASPGPALRRVLGRFAAAVAEYLPEEGRVELGQLRLEVGEGTRKLGLGPGRLTLTRTRDRALVNLLSGSAEQRTPLTVRLDLPLRDGAVKAELAGGPVSLAAFGVREGSLGLRDVSRAELEAQTQLELSPDGHRITFAARGRAQGLSLEHPRLARQALAGISLGWSGQGQAELDGSRVRIQRAELIVGNVHLRGKADIERAPDFTKLGLEAGVPLAACQDLLDAVPTGLLPLLEGMRASGTFALDTSVELDTRRPADTRVRWKMRDECRIASVPEAISPRRFQQVWERDVLGADGQRITIQSGPGSPTWVPRPAISNYLEAAVLVCEDGSFFRHGGFDSEAIANSLRENLKSGTFVRGASTVSMQLAKNVYLAREKTLSRKLQESVLTRLLEQELSKDQILELYLNVIEFGPGIYGVGPAAEYYFKTTPNQLSLAQAFFLGSILPSPKRQRFLASGELHSGWANYLRTLMRIAFKRHLITEQELEQGLHEQVVFQVPGPARVPDDAIRDLPMDDSEGALLPPEDHRPPPPGALRSDQARRARVEDSGS
jgi:hypothetical protein